MTVADQPANNTNVAKLERKYQGESLWADSWRRLRRNRLAVLGGLVILVAIFVAIFASVIAPFSYDQQVLTSANSAPQWVINLFPTMKAQGEPGGYVKVSEMYLLGADNLGRDLFSRIIYGARISLSVAFIGPLFSIMVGMAVGLVAGYAGGRTDNFLMRFVDLMYAFPTTLFVILLLAIFRGGASEAAPGSFVYNMSLLDRQMGGLLFVFIGIGLTSWMGMARLVRGQVLSVREKEYIEAAKSLGSENRTVVLRHILPNILGPIIIAETLTIPTYISYEAFLSFIGLGVNPPTPSWGSMISEGSQRITSYPNQALFPALALFMIMFAFNFLGDGLRDALDPRMRGSD